jgi:hypothetical protein
MLLCSYNRYKGIGAKYYNGTIAFLHKLHVKELKLNLKISLVRKRRALNVMTLYLRNKNQQDTLFYFQLVCVIRL